MFAVHMCIVVTPFVWCPDRRILPVTPENLSAQQIEAARWTEQGDCVVTCERVFDTLCYETTQARHVLASGTGLQRHRLLSLARARFCALLHVVRDLSLKMLRPHTAGARRVIQGATSCQSWAVEATVLCWHVRECCGDELRRHTAGPVAH